MRRSSYPAQLENQQAQLISENAALRNRLALRITIALDTAATLTNPYTVNDPFNAFLVESATDNNTFVQMGFTSPETYNLQNYATLKANVSARLDQPVKGAYLIWPAQPGKQITVLLFLGVQFFPGSFLQQISGGVNVLTGSAMTSNGNLTITSSPAQLVQAADSTRKRTTITVLSGATVYLGGASSTVGQSGAVAGSLTGIPVPVGASYEVTHQGPIYAVTDSASALIAVNSEN